MPAFGPDSLVVRPDHVNPHRASRWLLWPALRYRVVSPLVHEQRLNAFQSAVLGLVRTGFREAGDFSRLLGLQADLIDLVCSDLTTLGYIDQNRTITGTGRQALKDGFLDPTRSIITYVYQDLSTGTLWPVSTMDPGYCPGTWRTRRSVSLQLGTAGAPVKVDAFVVQPVDWTGTEPPTHELVVEAVSQGEASKRQGGGRVRRWAVRPPERVISRVTLITSGQPVWIPVPLVRKRGDPEEALVTWNAISPFTGQASAYLRRLVATRVQQSAELRDFVDGFIGGHTDALMLEYDLLNVELRRSYAEILEDRFTSQIRDHPEFLELLTLLERDMVQARKIGDGCSQLGDVARNAWRLHEALLRECVARNLPPTQVRDGLRDPLAPQLSAYCRQIGLAVGERDRLIEAKCQKVREALSRDPRGTTPNMLAATVISAAHGGPGHPFGRLAAVRPHLLTEMTNLSRDRNNSGAHGTGVPLNLEFGETAWRLTQDTMAAYLGLPLPAVQDRREGTAE